MALNFPGPQEIRLYYTVATRQHIMRLNIETSVVPAVGTPFDEIEVVRQIGTTPRQLDVLVDQWVALLVPRYNSGDATFDFAELWTYVAESFDATYVSTYAIAASGTAGSATYPAGEAIITFRTVEGGIMRLHLMESVRNPGPSLVYADAATPEQDIIDFVLAGGGYFLARDTSPPVAMLRLHPGVNERLFKRLYRS